MITADQLRLHLAKENTRPDDIMFFVTRLDRYSHLAQAPVTVKPPSVAGRHMSVRLRKGWRLWGFESAEDRNKFIRDHDDALPFYIKDNP